MVLGPEDYCDEEIMACLIYNMTAVAEYPIVTLHGDLLKSNHECAQSRI